MTAWEGRLAALIATAAPPRPTTAIVEPLIVPILLVPLLSDTALFVNTAVIVEPLTLVIATVEDCMVTIPGLAAVKVVPFTLNVHGAPDWDTPTAAPPTPTTVIVDPPAFQVPVPGVTVVAPDGGLVVRFHVPPWKAVTLPVLIPIGLSLAKIIRCVPMFDAPAPTAIVVPLTL